MVIASRWATSLAGGHRASPAGSLVRAAHAEVPPAASNGPTQLMRHALHWTLVAALLGWAAPPLGAADAAPSGPEAPAVRFDLAEVLRRAGERYPEVAVAAAELDAARALDSQARWSRFSPRLSVTGAFGLVPGARGSIEYSPDTARDLNNFGPFWRSRLDVSWPLFTFGALEATHRGARLGLASRDERRRSRAAAGQLLAARAYLGYLLAVQSLELSREVRSHLDDLLARLEQPDDEAPTDTLALFKARNYDFQLDRLEAEARSARALAAAGLRELVGEAARPAAEGLVALEIETPDLEAVTREALEANAELREASLAAEARSALADAARRERLPALSLDGRLDYGRAPGRTAQDNPFVYDPFNVRTLTAAFGLRWDLNLKQSGARAWREAAEARTLRARADALRARQRADLARLHAEIGESREVYESSRRAVSSTANWLRVAEENHGLGTAEPKDVIEAYGAYVQAKAAHLRAIHDLNLAVIAWRLACGRPPLAEGETL